MNHSSSPCETYLEQISLRAAGCLTDQEERELHEHLVACAACGTRARELEFIAARLTAARPCVDLNRVHEIASRIESRPVSRWSASWMRDTRFVALAASVLVLVSVLSYQWVRSTSPRPVPPTQVVQPSPRPAPRKERASQPPTLAELRLAAAKSDESLNQLLGSYPKLNKTISKITPSSRREFRP